MPRGGCVYTVSTAIYTVYTARYGYVQLCTLYLQVHTLHIRLYTLHTRLYTQYIQLDTAMCSCIHCIYSYIHCRSREFTPATARDPGNLHRPRHGIQGIYTGAPPTAGGTGSMKYQKLRYVFRRVSRCYMRLNHLGFPDPVRCRGKCKRGNPTRC